MGQRWINSDSHGLWKQSRRPPMNTLKYIEMNKRTEGTTVIQAGRHTNIL